MLNWKTVNDALLFATRCEMKNFDFPFNPECPTCRNDLNIGPPRGRQRTPLKNQRIAGALRTFLTSGSLTSGHLGFVGIEPFTNRLYDNRLKTLSQPVTQWGICRKWNTFQQQGRSNVSELMGNDEWCSV